MMQKLFLVHNELLFLARELFFYNVLKGISTLLSKEYEKKTLLVKTLKSVKIPAYSDF